MRSLHPAVVGPLDVKNSNRELYPPLNAAALNTTNEVMGYWNAQASGVLCSALAVPSNEMLPRPLMPFRLYAGWLAPTDCVKCRPLPPLSRHSLTPVATVMVDWSAASSHSAGRTPSCTRSYYWQHLDNTSTSNTCKNRYGSRGRSPAGLTTGQTPG